MNLSGDVSNLSTAATSPLSQLGSSCSSDGEKEPIRLLTKPRTSQALRQSQSLSRWLQSDMTRAYR